MATTADSEGHFISDLTQVIKVLPTHVLELEDANGSYHITGQALYADISKYINTTPVVRGLQDGVQELHEIIDGLRARIEALEGGV